ncbi:N-acetyl sugar amidotransferase [Alphaproteobacteria bacterium]|nr:N-acetyl sugar amidotransferase [Alphaproteobacteria bacterium]
MSAIRQCARCVMDTSDPNITFDSNNVCDHCQTFEKEILPSWNFGKNQESKLEDILKRIKKDSVDSEFNCILGMSGGVDSSYLLHLLVNEFGLKPLVFHVDGGWNTKLAVENIENIVNALNLDLYTEVINWREMQDLQRSFFKSGVSHIDTPQDHAFFAKMYEFANKYKIKSIITGGNYSTECIRNPKNWMYYQSDKVQIIDIQKKFGTLKLTQFPLVNIFWYKFYLPIFKNIKLYRLLDYVEYNKEEALNLLEKKYNYQRYPQKHFESRFTKFYESYWLYERFGYDVRKVQLSSLILTNQLKRQEALQILLGKPYTNEYLRLEKEYIANKLDVSMSTLEDYFSLSKKTYKDYKNQENFYKIGTKIFRFFGFEKGGKR